VAVTDVRHVRRRRDGGPGMVRFDHERTVVVAPRSPEAVATAGRALEPDLG